MEKTNGMTQDELGQGVVYTGRVDFCGLRWATALRGKDREGGVAVASATGVVRKPVIVTTEVETVGGAAGGKVTGTGGTSEDTSGERTERWCEWKGGWPWQRLTRRVPCLCRLAARRSASES